MAKKIALRNWSLVALFFVGFIYFLMVSGKEHSIILNNKGGESGIQYSIDGENYQDLGTKKIQRFVQGNSHTIYFKKANGEKSEKEFFLSFSENEIEMDMKKMIAEVK